MSDQDRQQARERLQALHDNAFLRGLAGGEDAALWAAVDAVLANPETAVKAAGGEVRTQRSRSPLTGEQEEQTVAVFRSKWREVATDEQR